MQRKLYQRSREQPERTFDDLYNLVHHPITLAEAWRRVSRRKASRTAGVDGTTRWRIENGDGGVEGFLADVRRQLKDGSYRPRPVRERLIPKPGKPGKFRALGIPTIRDRVVQMALKLVLEPIFEADFYPCSFGFRPGRCTMDAIAQIAQYLVPNKKGPSPYKFVIEGDIKACFDTIDHHLLMNRVRRRIADLRVLRLVRAFLKAGVMSEGTLRHPSLGTPQGGVISPLLANVYLQGIEERYARYVQRPREDTRRSNNARARDRSLKRPVFVTVRYADDFVVLVAGSQHDAEEEKRRLAEYIRSQLRMELSAEKTLVTPLTVGFRFLGFRAQVAPSRASGVPVMKATVPNEAKARFRSVIRAHTKGTQSLDVHVLLMKLNWVLTGWRNYYRFTVGANRVFAALDLFICHRVQRWLRRKFPNATAHELRRRFEVRPRPTYKAWADRGVILRRMTDGGTQRYLYRGPRIQNGWDDRATGVLAARREARETNYAMRVLEELDETDAGH